MGFIDRIFGGSKASDPEPTPKPAEFFATLSKGYLSTGPYPTYKAAMEWIKSQKQPHLWSVTMKVPKLPDMK